MTMKRLGIIIGILIFTSQISFGQISDGLIELGKAYRQFMFRNNPPSEFLKGLEKYDSTELAYPAKFIREAIMENSSILSDTYLKRPIDKDLKYLYIIVHINYNLRKDNPRDNKELINELESKNILTQDLVDNYYSMLITCYGNKVKPFDMSKENFDLNSYGLKDDTEKAIMFLEVMRLCGLQIWGYINVVKPPKYELALEYINKYPKFNSLPYYQFLDLNFPDFQINIESQEKVQSYKLYYIDNYYETLLNHLTCLNETHQDKEGIYDLVLGSLLKEENFYKYSKNEKRLKKLFTEYKE
jgi:hypothetical protein